MDFRTYVVLDATSLKAFFQWGIEIPTGVALDHYGGSIISDDHPLEGKFLAFDAKGTVLIHHSRSEAFSEKGPTLSEIIKAKQLTGTERGFVNQAYEIIFGRPCDMAHHAEFFEDFGGSYRLDAGRRGLPVVPRVPLGRPGGR
jgi:hypothetical protein